jgi:hypothetical protein
MKATPTELFLGSRFTATHEPITVSDIFTELALNRADAPLGPR